MTELIPGLQSSLALWHLRLESEVLFVGDAGETEPHRASKRYGIEWNNHYVAKPWLFFDADLWLSHSRFTQHDDAGDTIAGSIRTVASLGATLAARGPWFGAQGRSRRRRERHSFPPGRAEKFPRHVTACF